MPAEGVIPQAGLVGDMRISYSKFLQLLETNRVKRLVVYGDMKTAVVEVPHPWCVHQLLIECTKLSWSNGVSSRWWHAVGEHSQDV